MTERLSYQLERQGQDFAVRADSPGEQYFN
jgi:hypothetical protein